MSVLVEPGHQTTYPLNHARIMWRSVITGATATGSRTNYPASAALTKTTYERWSPAVTGDSLTLTFPQQYINCVALAAHSNLTPTVEVRVAGQWETITAYPPAGETLDLDFAADEYAVLEYSPDNEAVMFLIAKRLADAVRITVDYTGAAPTLGVVMAGTVLEMHRPLYGGHNPAMLSSDSRVQPNVSESGEWLGASQLRKGRSVNLSWQNLPAAWVRKNWQPFAQGLKTNPFVVAWNPLRASADAIYCSSSEQPRPSNTGTRDLQSVSLSARGYSDGTDPVVRPVVSKDLLDLVTFTRASEATYYDAQGVLRTAAVDEPRLTYDPETGEALGLLIEEARTNLLLWSEAFDNAVWVKDDSTITADAEIAPDGSQTMDLLVPNAGTGVIARVRQARAMNQGATASFSFFAKALEINWLRALTVGATSGTVDAWFNAATGETGISGGSDLVSVDAEPAGNGVYRFTITFVLSAGTTPTVYIQAAQADGTAAYTGDGTDRVAIWGAQLEAGSFPTSYIKTEGAQVTREADNASVDTLTPWFNADSFTLFVESFIYELEGDKTFMALSNPTADSAKAYFALQLFLGVFRVGLRTNSGSFVSVSTSGGVGTHRLAVSFSGGVATFAVDGEVVGQQSDIRNNDAENLYIGNFRSSTPTTGRLVNIDSRFIPRALSATELQALTAP